MSVSVSMPQLGESVTEGTVTRWLKKEGERVEVDEPLLEVSTDKVDTEIPSPASGILRGIAVDEDETVAVGAQLAVIEDSESGDAAPAADDSASAEAAEPAQPDASQSGAPQPEASQAEASQPEASQPEAPQSEAPQSEASQPEQAPAASSGGWSSQPNYAPPASPPPASPGYSSSSGPSTPAYAPPPAYGQPQPAAPYGQPGLIGSRLQPASAVGVLRVVPAPAAEAALRAESAPRLPRLRPMARPRLRSTRRPRRCRAAATRPTSPRWSASSPPSMP